MAYKNRRPAARDPVIHRRGARRPIYKGTATYTGQTITFPDEMSIKQGHVYSIKIYGNADRAVVFAYDSGNDRLFTIGFLPEEWDLKWKKR